MFGKSGRFDGPGSYHSQDVIDAENSPRKSNLPKTPINYLTGKLKSTSLKAPGTPPQVPFENVSSPRLEKEYIEGLPSYMQPTRASSQKKGVVGGKMKDSERLQFKVGEGADMLQAPLEFTRNTKGYASMRKEKHGRFSMADSFLKKATKDKIDHCGLGHDDYKPTLKSGPSGYIPNLNVKDDRFGKGSYMEFLRQEEEKNAKHILGHEEFVPKGGATFRKSTSGRDTWVNKQTYLQDKDLAQCEGIHGIASPTRGDFDKVSEKFMNANEDPCFKNKTARFKELDPEPGQSFLGPELESSVNEAKSGVVYKSKNKHGRFSEFGGVWSKYQNNLKESGGECSGPPPSIPENETA